MLSFKRLLEDETLILDVRVLVGNPDDAPEARSEYRDAIITFTGVKLFVVECPDPSSAFFSSGPVWFSADQSEPGALSPEIERKVVGSAEMYSLYILDWESRIHIAAADMSFEWSPAPTLPEEQQA
jgi:hypothetical protein